MKMENKNAPGASSIPLPRRVRWRGVRVDVSTGGGARRATRGGDDWRQAGARQRRWSRGE